MNEYNTTDTFVQNIDSVHYMILLKRKERFERPKELQSTENK